MESSIKEDEKYFDGICMICHERSIKVRHINIYHNGSEGLFICHKCEMEKLLPFVRQCVTEGFRIKKAKFLNVCFHTRERGDKV